jgi:hypothetical protein
VKTVDTTSPVDASVQDTPDLPFGISLMRAVTESSSSAAQVSNVTRVGGAWAEGQ